MNPSQPSKRFDYYVNQCREFHATRKTFSGRHIWRFLPELKELVQRHDVSTMLDYGCGKGMAYSDPREFGPLGLADQLGVHATLFDPGVPEFQKRPEGVHDLVCCVDVVEHVPAEDIPWLVGDLFSFTGKALLVTPSTKPAKKNLPNGENAHVTVRPESWWREQFEAYPRGDRELVLIFDR